MALTEKTAEQMSSIKELKEGLVTLQKAHLTSSKPK
jgi:hypothetical protein